MDNEAFELALREMSILNTIFIFEMTHELAWKEEELNLLIMLDEKIKMVLYKNDKDVIDYD